MPVRRTIGPPIRRIMGPGKRCEQPELRVPEGRRHPLPLASVAIHLRRAGGCPPRSPSVTLPRLVAATHVAKMRSRPLSGTADTQQPTARPEQEPCDGLDLDGGHRLPTIRKVENRLQIGAPPRRGGAPPRAPLGRNERECTVMSNVPNYMKRLGTQCIELHRNGKVASCQGGRRGFKSLLPLNNLRF